MTVWADARKYLVLRLTASRQMARTSGFFCTATYSSRREPLGCFSPGSIPAPPLTAQRGGGKRLTISYQYDYACGSTARPIHPSSASWQSGEDEGVARKLEESGRRCSHPRKMIRYDSRVTISTAKRKSCRRPQPYGASFHGCWHGIAPVGAPGPFQLVRGPQGRVSDRRGEW